jgi:hypothetical protein
MSFFEDASLVYIPAAIKNGKTYSIKPTDGTGDLTFTRASSATRVGPNGYIEKVRTNYCLHSQNFASWSLLGAATRTTGVTDPNGGTTAATISNIPSGNTTDGIILSGNPMTIGSDPILGSIWLKGSGTIAIALERGVSGDYFFYITTITLTSTWTRYSIGGANAGARDGFTFYVCNRTGTTATSVDVAFAQVEFGDVATDYIATTTAAVSVGPVSGTPRLDYLGSDCGRLLLEPARTNLISYSESFNNGYWAGSGGVTPNTAISPDGYQNADTNASGGVYPAVPWGGDATATNTASIFAKANPSGASTLRIYFNRYGFGDAVYCDYNLTNGTASAVTFVGSAVSGTAKIENYGNGWYRCILTGIVSTSAGTLSFNPINDCYIWGAQVEAAAYATSYIPTLGTAVTRVADAASRTSVSSLIGQTAGTIYAEWTANNVATSGRILAIGDGTFANRIAILEDGGTVRVFISTSSVVQVDLSSLGSYTGTHKIAVAYASNDLKVYIDGVAVVTQTSLSVPPCSVVYVGTFEDGTGTTPLGGGIAQALLFKTRLSNAQLAELTTL